MRYNEPLSVKLYKYASDTFELQAIIDDYAEISFSHNLYEAGDFTITINFNIPNAKLFERGLFVQFGSDEYMFGEILSITDSIAQDGKGSQVRTITGKDARYLFKRRVIKNMNSEGSWVMTAKGETCLRSLVYDQCGLGAEEKRRLPIANVIPQPSDALGSEYSVSEQFSNLYDTLVTIATQSEIGWRVRFDGALTLEVSKGSDLSDSVQFSTDFDSLSNGTFTDTSESYANSVYIGGKGTGDDRDIYEGEVEGAAGLSRYEAFDNQSQMTSENEYEAEALSMLSQYGQTVTIAGNGLAKCPYIFKEQYDIGDIITIAFSGKSAKAQILGVTEHWAFGQYGITFSFGKPVNDLNRQLQLILKQIQKASNKTTTTSSVKYYTIPTDTQMPKSDVIYDTIGFVGECASGGSTFQLYLDNEKTGAKTYHVYFKQLAGGKLTLTTGVTGASNLVMNSGTYVAIIYVDAQGNVTMEGATATDTIQTGNNQPASSSGVAGAISDSITALDVASVGGDGKYIKAISETNGKISATEGTISDKVADGDTNPVTSNAVADALAVPTDAVLHYSFDDVPDYPDGTAVYRKNNDFTSNDNWVINSGNIAYTNGILVITSNGNTYFYKSISFSNCIVKIRLKTSFTGSMALYATGSSSSQLIVSVKEGQTQDVIYSFSGNCTAIGFTNVPQGTIEISAIYIGNGSYTTPIIDNSGNGINATNNGAVAVQGVCGKGGYFLNGKYAKMDSDFSFTPNFSISLWIKPDNNTNGLQGIILRNGQMLLRNGDTNENFLMFILTGANGTLLNRQNIGSLLPPNVWTHLAIVRNGTSFSVYTNGEETYHTALADATIVSTVSDFFISQNNLTRPQIIDDILCFNRALSAEEVTALYLNKANTPKYFNLNNYELAKKLPPPPTADGNYTLQVNVASGVATYSWS